MWNGYCQSRQRPKNVKSNFKFLKTSNIISVNNLPQPFSPSHLSLCLMLVSASHLSSVCAFLSHTYCFCNNYHLSAEVVNDSVTPVNTGILFLFFSLLFVIHHFLSQWQSFFVLFTVACSFTHSLIHTHVHTNVHTHVHTNVHTHTHTHTHTHKHTHIHSHSLLAHWSVSSQPARFR